MPLTHEILFGTYEGLRKALMQGHDVNAIDKYGYTPLIEAAIMNNNQAAKLLLQYGADVDKKDLIGQTALYWAVDNYNYELASLLLNQGANPNAYNTAGQPVLANAILRDETDMQRLLIHKGADPKFAGDYINTKLIGHRFELEGRVDIITHDQKFYLIEFEGFYLDFTLGIIKNSLEIFWDEKSKGRNLSYEQELQTIVKALKVAAHLRQFKRYFIKIEEKQAEIDPHLANEFLIIPVSYHGHAITFIKYKNLLAKCDRGPNSKIEGSVNIYQINNLTAFDNNFVKNLLYDKHSDEFITNTYKNILDLEFLTEIPTRNQISGNCTWANVEACIPTGLFMQLLHKEGTKTSPKKIEAVVMKFYKVWFEWNKDKALDDAIVQFNKGSSKRKASYASILAAILYQRLDYRVAKDVERAKKIITILTRKDMDYILKTYVSILSNPKAHKFSSSFMKMLKKLNINLMQYGVKP